MAAIGEQSLQWFSAEGIAAESKAEPDLTALVRDHSGLPARVALSILRTPAEAEDVVQDAFVRVLERRHQLAGIVDIRPWLVRIAWNLALDRRRRIRPEQMDEVFAESLVGNNLPADIALNEAQRMKAVFREIERLPKAERQVLLLSALEELETV